MGGQVGKMRPAAQRVDIALLHQLFHAVRPVCQTAGEKVFKGRVVLGIDGVEAGTEEGLVQGIHHPPPARGVLAGAEKSAAERFVVPTGELCARAHNAAIHVVFVRWAVGGEVQVVGLLGVLQRTVGVTVII